MKYFWLFILLFLTTCGILCYTCQPFPGPRDINGKAEWTANREKLKALALDIVRYGNKKYTTGINPFPKGFSYPFDDGFAIDSRQGSQRLDSLDTAQVTISFFMDRGLLDHYQAIVFTNDPLSIIELDDKTVHGVADYSLETGWYMIHD